jgi:hypothetical protein
MTSVVILRILRRTQNGSFEEIKPCLTYEAASDYLYKAIQNYMNLKSPEWPSPDIGTDDLLVEYDRGPHGNGDVFDMITPEKIKSCKKPSILYRVIEKMGMGKIDFQVSIK